MKKESKPLRNPRYWKINVTLIFILLAIWATISCVCGIILIEPLNSFSIGQLPLGFWIANQGSMLVFIVLILVYAVTMDFVDRHFQSAAQQGSDDE